jgi:hypothetical protein
MLAHTYEQRFAEHSDYPTLWQIRRTIRQLYAQPRKERAADFHQKISRLRERAEELELRIREALFSSSRVVSCTLTGAASPLLVGQHFHTLFIDEAAQALEAACWIPMQRVHRVILAGDHQQLPPTIKSPEALRGGLGITLMEQLAESKPECVHLLTVQYRMNEALMRFSSDWFYGGNGDVKNHIQGVEFRKLLEACFRYCSYVALSISVKSEERFKKLLSPFDNMIPQFPKKPVMKE